MQYGTNPQPSTDHEASAEAFLTDTDPNLVEAPNNTQKFVQDLYDVYVQIEPLSEKEKEVKAKIKEAGLNPSIIAAIAKAKVQGKLGELEEKSAEILNAIDKLED